MKKVSFPCKDFELEGILDLSGTEDRSGLVIVCHPHPLYGGSMHNRVVYAVCKKLSENGLAWLKFNFRGVEGSGGRFDGGRGEQEDIEAAISFGIQQPEIDARKVGLCGYSFGSMVALAVAARDPRVKAVAGISPLLEGPSFLEKSRIPKLFASGTDDEFVDSRKLERVVMDLPEPKELIIYSGEDHFWTRHEEPMTERVARFFKKAFESIPT